MCCSRKYPYCPHRRVFGLNPPPFWKFQFRLIHSFTILAFKTPSPLEFPMALCGGVEIFFETTQFANIAQTDCTPGPSGSKQD